MSFIEVPESKLMTAQKLATRNWGGLKFLRGGETLKLNDEFEVYAYSEDGDLYDEGEPGPMVLNYLPKGSMWMEEVAAVLLDYQRGEVIFEML